MTGLSSAFKINGLAWGQNLKLISMSVCTMMFPAGFLQLCHRIPGQEPPTDVGGLIATERNVQHWPFC